MSTCRTEVPGFTGKMQVIMPLRPAIASAHKGCRPRRVITPVFGVLMKSTWQCCRRIRAPSVSVTPLFNRWRLSERVSLFIHRNLGPQRKRVGCSAWDSIPRSRHAGVYRRRIKSLTEPLSVQGHRHRSHRAPLNLGDLIPGTFCAAPSILLINKLPNSTSIV